MKNHIRMTGRIVLLALVLVVASAFAMPETASALSKKPERVTVIKADSTCDTVTLTWKPSEHATSYVIYRCNNKYGFYREIGATEKNTYTDKNLQTGKALWYKIKAMNDGRGAWKSPRISAVPTLSAPDLTYEATGEGIYLKLGEVDGADGYVIYRDGKALGHQKRLTYLDNEVTANHKHKYQAIAYRHVEDKVVPSEFSRQLTASRPSMSLSLRGSNSIPELHQGETFDVKGKIKANTTIEQVTVGVLSQETNKWVKTCKFVDKAVNDMEFDVADANESLALESLEQGAYYYKVTVKMKAGTEKTLLNREFTVSQPPGPVMIVEQAVACAWPYGTPRSKFRYGSGVRTDAYTQALSVAYGSRSGWSSQTRAGASCDVFVGTVIRSCGYDKGFPRGLDEVEAYCRKHPEKWENLGAATESQLQPGDVIFQRYNSGGGHICIYLGNNRVANAHYVSKTYAVIEKYSSKVKSPGSCRRSIVYRAIQ